MGDYLHDLAYNQGAKASEHTKSSAGAVFDIFPGDLAEILIVEDGVRKIVPSAYGLVPTFIPKGKTKPSKLYNCRNDSLNGLEMKPSFRDAFLKRRCITAVTVIEENMGSYFPYFRITGTTAVAAVVLSLLLGLLAGLIPAYRASRLNVIDALRRVG